MYDILNLYPSGTVNSRNLNDLLLDRTQLQFLDKGILTCETGGLTLGHEMLSHRCDNETIKTALKSCTMEYPCSSRMWEPEPQLLTRCFYSIKFTFREILFSFFHREVNHEGQTDRREWNRNREKLKHEVINGTEKQIKNGTL